MEVQAEPIQCEWLTYPQASEYTGLGKTKLWELSKSGQIKVARIGKSVRFPRRELDRFMEESCDE